MATQRLSYSDVEGAAELLTPAFAEYLLFLHDRFTPKERSFIERLDMFFLATGNVDATQRVGLLFIDFERQRRIRVDGTAELRHDDRLLERYPAAQFVVRVHAERIYPNCPRYIHRYELVKRSRFVPRTDCATPVPAWKRSDWAFDALPANDPARDPGERDVLGR